MKKLLLTLVVVLFALSLTTLFAQEPAKEPEHAKKIEAVKHELLNLNTATEEQLVKLGLTPECAKEVIDARTKGLFKTVEDIKAIKCVEPMFDKIKDKVEVKEIK